MITVTVWHNVAADAQGRHIAMLDGYQPGNPMVRVFAYQADPGRRCPEAAAEEAFAMCNGHTCDPGGEDLSRCYYARELRSLSFPGSSRCCSRSCCLHRRAVWPVVEAAGRADVLANVSQLQGGRTDDGQDLAEAGAAARPAQKVRRR